MNLIEILNFANFAIFTIWMSVIDIREKRLPNRLMYWAISVALVLALVDILLFGNLSELRTRFIPTLGATLLFFAMYLVYPKGIGMGDIKGILLLGISLSALDGALLIIAIMASFLLAAIFIITYRIVKRKTFTEIAFGPFLFFPGLLLLAANFITQLN